jgi:hypothetical protein
MNSDEAPPPPDVLVARHGHERKITVLDLIKLVTASRLRLGRCDEGNPTRILS